MKNALRALTVAAGLAAASAAQATPSTTVWAPSTTYTQPYLVPHITYDTYFRKDASYPVTTGLTMGISPSEIVQSEVGFDLLYPANDPLVLNAKVTLVEDKLASFFPALSLGIANAGITNTTNYAMGYALVGKTIAGVSLTGGVYYGFDDKLWVDKNGAKDQVGALASIALPAIKVGQPFLDSIVLAADVQTGNNIFSAGGVAASFYFTPSIAVLTGPVFFLARETQPNRSDFMWTVQLDVDAPLRKVP
jgi:hypothetical protein